MQLKQTKYLKDSTLILTKVKLALTLELISTSSSKKLELVLEKDMPTQTNINLS